MSNLINGLNKNLFLFFFKSILHFNLKQHTFSKSDDASCGVKTSQTPCDAIMRNCAYWSIGTDVVYGSTNTHFFNLTSPWLPRPLVVPRTPLTLFSFLLSLISPPAEKKKRKVQ